MSYTGIVLDGEMAGQRLEHFDEIFRYKKYTQLRPTSLSSWDGRLQVVEGRLVVRSIQISGRYVWFWVDARAEEPPNGWASYIIDRLCALAMKGAEG